MPSIHFESVADMCAHVRALPASVGNYRLATLERRGGWLGIEDGECTDIFERAIYGTSAATAQIVAMLGQVRAAAATDTRIHTVRADTGRIDVWAAMRGDAMSCTRRKRGNVRAPKIVRLTVPTAISCNQDASVVQWRAVCAIVAADALTAAGYNVEIVASCFFGDDNAKNHDLRADWAVKAASAPLDLAAVAGALLPSTVRGVCFQALTGLSKYPDKRNLLASRTIDQTDPLTVRAIYDRDQPHERGDRDAVLAEAQRMIDAVAL